MSITSNSPESPQINSQALIQLKRALEGTEASLLYVKRKLDYLAKNWELAHSCQDSRHEPNGFDWVRQLELAFSMISNGSVEIHQHKNCHNRRAEIVICISFGVLDSHNSWNSKTLPVVSDLFRQVFEENIVQDVSHSTPHNKFGVA